MRECSLHAVVDIDGVDVGVGAQREADGQIVGTVISAGGFHVEHLVDADDLRLDWLCDARLDDGGRSAWIGGGDLHLRRHNVWQLSDRDTGQCQQASNRDDHRYDDRQSRTVHKYCRDHYFAPASVEVFEPSLAGLPLLSSEGVREVAGWALAGPGETVSPGRTRCKPSLTTSSPSFKPLITTAVEGVDWLCWMRRICALFCESTI